MPRFAITIACGACLLFLMQPMAGKRLLPWFGGGAAVWAACLMFFQVALLAGYLYAHAIARLRSPRWQAAVHVGVLAASFLLLPIEIDLPDGTPAAADSPVASIVLALALGIGAPFVLLAAASPLLQHWFSRSHPGRSPYRLYAVSNIGSLAALAAYPVLVEPWLGLTRQFELLRWGYVVFALGCGWCAANVALRREPASNAFPPDLEDAATEAAESGRISPRTWFFWLALPAWGTIMLIACTNQLTQEVASSPFLWVLPLGLYLLTFIVCFDRPRWYRRKIFAALLPVVALAACAALYAGASVPFGLQLLVYCSTLLVCCLTLHGELVAMRPATVRLTSFYLAIALGGSLGGVFCVAVAPAVFNGLWEFHIGLAGTCVLVLFAARHNRAWDFSTHRLSMRIAFIGIVVLVFVLIGEASILDGQALAVRRNFYGVLRVIDDASTGQRILAHGRVQHGMQFVDPDKRRTATLVFGDHSAIGLAMRHRPRRAAGEGDNGLRVGVIGLGIGTIAAHGRPGDSIRFYEINPAVEDLCREYFTFLADSPAQVRVAIGDGRVLLASEPEQAFDILAVDAFSGDAIPTHLLTAECGQVYVRHLRPGGLLLFHISNDFVDLVPVVQGLAEPLGWRVWRVESPADPAQGVIRAVWMVMAAKEHDLPAELLQAADAPSADVPPAESARSMLWTDDFAPVWRVLK